MKRKEDLIYDLPSDSEDLFKNNYRITNKDTSGVKSILSNNIFKAFQAKLDILRSEKPSKFEVEPFNGWAEGKIPGEESFIAGKIGEIETIFLLTSVETSFISSSIVREIIQYNCAYENLVPAAVKTNFL